MKNIQFIVLFLLGTMHLHAQDWRPIQPGYIYLYDDPAGKYYSLNTGMYHIRVLSKNAEGNDSVYNLNKAALKIIPSSDYLNNYFSKLRPEINPELLKAFGILIENQPYFLNTKVRISGGNWTFEGNDTFVLKPAAAKGDTWTFSDSRSITAEITDIKQESFLGITDDVKTITLSTGDIIKLSKNHGIISFPAFDGNHKHYSLKGVEGPDVGIIIPRAKKIYDFQPGDTFQYKNKRSGRFGNGEFISQMIIKSRTETSNKIRIEFLTINLIQGKVSLTNDVIEIEDEGTDPLNLFPGQVLPNSAKPPGHGYFFDNTLGRSGRNFAKWDYILWEYLKPWTDTIIPTGFNVYADYQLDHVSGLGRTYEYYKDTEGNLSETLLTSFLKTDGSHMGIIQAIDISTNVQDVVNPSPRGQVYPNPANGETMTVTGHLSRPGILQFTMTDLQGRMVMTQPAIELPAGDFQQNLDISQLSSGIYLLNIKGADLNETLKVSVVR